jgi:hypothetical protein
MDLSGLLQRHASALLEHIPMTRKHPSRRSRFAGYWVKGEFDQPTNFEDGAVFSPSMRYDSSEGMPQRSSSQCGSKAALRVSLPPGIPAQRPESGRFIVELISQF